MKIKARYKFLFILLVLWLGMSYEGARNNQTTPVVGGYSRLDEQIAHYERGLYDSAVNSTTSHDEAGRAINSGNLIARTGRNIGVILEDVVREILRSIVRFFDGVIR